VQRVLPACAIFADATNAFDGRGNYTLGSRTSWCSEIDYTRVDKIKGMNITLTTTAKNDEEGRELLLAMGFPLRKLGERTNGTHREIVKN